MRWSFTAFLSVVKLNLHTQDIPHGLGGFLLCRGGDMGIGVQSEASGEVTQHAGHRLDVHTVLQRDGGEGVAEVMKSDLRDARSFQHTLQHVVDAVRGDGTTVGGGEDVRIFQLLRLCFLLLQYCSNKSNWCYKNWRSLQRQKTNCWRVYLEV